MIRLLVIAGLLYLFSGVGTVRADDRVSVGLKTGLNIASLYGDDAVDSSYRVSPTVGLFATIWLSNRFAVQPEVFWTRKGAGRVFVLNSRLAFNDLEITADYLELPLLIRYSPPTDTRLSYSLIAGPVPAFALGNKLSGDALRDETGAPGEKLEICNLRSFDLGLAFGVGLDFNSGSAEWLVDVRYTVGLSRIYEDFAGEPDAGEIALINSDSGGLDMKHGVLSLLVGVSF